MSTTASEALAADLLLDPSVIEDPYGFYRRLVEEAPVWRIPGTDIILVSSFDAICEAVGRTEDFSSNLVALLYRKDDGTPSVQPLDAGVHTLATADPPKHSVHRNAVFPELVARRMATLRTEIEALTDAYLDDVLGHGPVEVMHNLANPIPIRVVSKLIGFQDEDPDELLAAAFDSTFLLSATEPLDRLLASMERSVAVMGWIEGQLQATLGGREAEGILGVIGAAVASGELDLMEGFVIMATLLSAGGESTTSLLGNAIDILATDLALQERLRADNTLVKPFIEEVLRLESPFRYHLRHSTRTTELQGVTVPEGATMLLLWGAGNRDPGKYERPDEVVLDRPAPRQHLGFGRGIHLCVGAPLARLEAEVILSRLLERTRGFTHVEGDPPVRVSSLMVRRFERLPLQVNVA